MKRKKNTKNELLGFFNIESNLEVPGILKLDKENTKLLVHSNLKFGQENICSINGRLSSGKYITLLGCGWRNRRKSFGRDGVRYEGEIYAHHVSIGSAHLSEKESHIKKVSFTTSDMALAFNDETAFGLALNCKQHLTAMIKEEGQDLSSKISEDAIAIYFTGNRLILDVTTALGRISIYHHPSYDFININGAKIKNKIYASIEVESGLDIKDVLELVQDLSTFISFVTGRAQRISQIFVSVEKPETEQHHAIEVIPCFPWIRPLQKSQPEPFARDCPIDLMRDRQNFTDVLTAWASRHREWKPARIRYLQCIAKGSYYDIDRLTAAANMFDITPKHFYEKTSLAEDVTSVKAQCKKLAKALPESIDREALLQAIGRIGKLSLPKKVSSRIATISRLLGDRLPNLNDICRIAIDLRNYYTHGTEINYDAISPHQVFLTETLEFVFLASDLIDCGWNAQAWANSSRAQGHPLARFLADYEKQSGELLISVNGPPTTTQTDVAS